MRNSIRDGGYAERVMMGEFAAIWGVLDVAELYNFAPHIPLPRLFFGRIDGKSSHAKLLRYKQLLLVLNALAKRRKLHWHINCHSYLAHRRRAPHRVCVAGANLAGPRGLECEVA
jgi:hypothetical protein